MNRLLIVALFFFVAIPRAALAEAPLPEVVISISSLKVAIVEDGELTDNRLIVDLTILRHEGKLFADWEHIFVDPWEDKEVVVLKVEHFSTAKGTISDVRVYENAFAFVLDAGGREYQVVGKKKESGFELRGNALWRSEILKREMKMEWRSLDSPVITLPYKNVF